ncbi:MAG: hypothetical protein ACHQ1E_13140 [Ktedonobacterales bacterium]|jgi:hypothetical protein
MGNPSTHVPQNIAPPRPDRLHLLTQLRRATIEDQLAALDWLEQKFAKTRPRRQEE